MLEKIAKLLNQAENAGTEAEAAVFMAKAQQLAATHSIDLARARHATIEKQRTKPVQRTVHIGERGTRGLRTLVDLYLGIADANDVKCTIAHDATRVYAVGFAEDLDIAEALFASLQVQQANALAEFKKADTWKQEKVWHEGRYKGWDWIPGQYKPQTWLTARLNFQEAYAQRIRIRLISARDEARRAAENEELERKARPHLDGFGGLTEHFKQWTFDRHGVDLDEDDSTCQELSHGLLNARAIDVGGVIIPDEDSGELVAEILVEYMTACKQQSEGDNSMALVLVEKREALDEAFAPLRRAARGSYRGGTSGAASASGQSAGRSAADRARLGGGTAIGGTKGAISA